MRAGDSGLLLLCCLSFMEAMPWIMRPLPWPPLLVAAVNLGCSWDGFSILLLALKFLSCCSNFYNCFMNPGLGFAIHRFSLIKFKESYRDIPYSSMRYAMMQDVLLEIPAQQCTNTTPPFLIALYMKTALAMKCLPKFSQGTSMTYKTL